VKSKLLPKYTDITYKGLTKVVSDVALDHKNYFDLKNIIVKVFIFGVKNTKN